MYVAGAVILALGTATLWFYREALAARREKVIRSYVFFSAMFDKLREKHPHLTPKDCQLVARALREFFLAHLKSKRGFVGMPSRVVDDLWHEFILHTREYQRFCDNAFGKYFHHVPAGAMGKNKYSDEALRLTWRYACREENINPRKPTRMPLLFAIDEKLKIAGGFIYTLDQPRKAGKDTSSNCSGGGGGCGGGSSSSSSFACSGGGLIGDDASASAAGDSGGDSGCGGGGCGGGGD